MQFCVLYAIFFKLFDVNMEVLCRMYGKFVTRYEMACLEGNQFVNFVVRISHGLCFLYKAIQLFY